MRLRTIVFVFAALLLLAACQTNEPQPTEPAEPTAAVAEQPTAAPDRRSAR
jgi:hypothetical protein